MSACTLSNMNRKILFSNCMKCGEVTNMAFRSHFRKSLGVQRLKKTLTRPKRLLYVSTAIGASVVTVGYTVGSVTPTVGPIYEFENSSDLPLHYDVERMEKYFKQRPGQVFERTRAIFSEIGPYLIKLVVWEYLIRQKIRDHEGLQKKYAIQLREMLTRLGPCFIKLGQALSIRPDLLPSSFLFELQKLCDAVPSYPTADAIALIESELGAPVSAIFSDFDQSTRPIAAASLGQVYKVTLKEDNSVVGVKVQRPDMHSAILRDIYILRWLARGFQWLKTTITRQRPYDVALLDTFADATMKELDYLNEAANQTRCKNELEPRLKNKIYIPKVYDKYTTRKVLVTEWIQGIQLAKSSPQVINRLIPIGVECFLVQLLETGFFHADPHPGNLLVTEDQRLALIDFGLMADVPIQDTQTMTMTIVHLMQGDVAGLVDDAVQLGFLPENVNRSELVPVLQKVYDAAQLAAVEQSKLRYQAVQTRRRKFIAVSYDLNKIFYQYPFLVPAYFALITRAMIVLEGIAVTGNPDFDLFQAAYPFSLKRAVSLFGYSGITQIVKEAAGKLKELGMESELALPAVS